jgi:hypothetical protein
VHYGRFQKGARGYDEVLQSERATKTSTKRAVFLIVYKSLREGVVRLSALQQSKEKLTKRRNETVAKTKPSNGAGMFERKA